MLTNIVHIMLKHPHAGQQAFRRALQPGPEADHLPIRMPANHDLTRQEDEELSG
jgi:hypothetical protein